MDDMAYERNHVEAIIRQHEREGAPELGWDALIRLAEIVVKQSDGVAAAALLPRLMLGHMGRGAQHECVTDLKHLVAQSRVSGSSKAMAECLGVDTNTESYILVRLLQGGTISEGDYIVLLDELAAESQHEDGSSVTVLHMLEQRDSREFSKLLLFISRDAKTPIAPLARLRPSEVALSLVPMDFMKHHHVCAFDLLEEDLLVAVLNPYSRKLRHMVEDASSRRCKFFVAFPREMDDTLMLAQEALAVR